MVGADIKTINLVTSYMKMRNFHKHGYMKYYNFKRIIWYITQEGDPLKVRAIFQKLLDLNIIHKKQLYVGKKKAGLRYYFNPYEYLLEFEYIKKQ